MASRPAIAETDVVKVQAVLERLLVDTGCAAVLLTGRGGEPLAAMAARLGRDLATSAVRMGRASFSTAMFSGPDGPMFLAAAPIGYVVVLAEPRANLDAIRSATDEAVALIQAAWTPVDEAC